MGGRGGKRKGAGRKPGAGISAVKVLRTEARALLAEIVGTERDPLLIAINIASDPTNPVELRLEAALGSARFLHPVLSAAAVQHTSTPPDSAELISRLATRLGQVSASVTTINAAPLPAPSVLANPDVG